MTIRKFIQYFCGSSLLSTLWLLVFTTIPISTEASISPPRIQIEAKPREKVIFNLQVKNKNNTPRAYKVSYSYYTQDKDGYQKEIKLEDSSDDGPWNWIKLDSGEEFKLGAKETLPIEGTLKVPSKNSHGFHNILMTVTEITPTKKTGVTLNYATGSLIELTVAGSKKRPKTAILNPEIKTNVDSGESFIHLDFANKSVYKGRLFMEVHLRQNKRLVTKIPLLTDQSHKSNMSYSLVFPNNLVHLRGHVDKVLEPGDYEIRVIGKFNGVRLRSFNEKLRIDDSASSIELDSPNKQASKDFKHSL